MADATQLQLRRDTAANLATATPAEAEPGYDQTNKRFIIGDSLTAGGIPHVNYMDSRNMVFNRGTVGGTANAITLTMSPPMSSYQTGMKVGFIAAASNTGATTINIDGEGTRNIQKLSSGSLASLASGDIVAGSYYEISYNGTSFQLTTTYNSVLVSVSQGNLNTSTGTFSTFVGAGGLTASKFGFINSAINNSYTASVFGYLYLESGGTGIVNTLRFSTTDLTLPGGQYGFGINSYGYFSSGTAAINGIQRYVTSSPPYDLGDGEVAGFFYLLLNENDEIVGHYAADVPPWAYNGPTSVKCDHICPVTKKKFRQVIKKRTFEEVMDGAPITYKMEEITHKIKNADMGIIPTPFLNAPSDYKVILIDPMDDKVRRIIDYQNSGGTDWVEAIKSGHIVIDNDKCKRCGPKGVKIHKMKYKYKGKF